MAPESARATMSECVRCKDSECFVNRCPCTCHILKPAAPPDPASCSEVVERLAKLAGVGHKGIAGSNMASTYATFDTEKAEAILHSWRERRVQELEDGLGRIRKSLEMAKISSTARFTDQFMAEAEAEIERLLKSEWREQIRKGAKHE